MDTNKDWTFARSRGKAILYRQKEITNSFTINDKTMLNQLSWTTYFEIIIFLTAIYYTYILFKYYRYDIGQLFQSSSGRNETSDVPEVLRYEKPAKIPTPAVKHFPDARPGPAYTEEVQEGEEFIAEIKGCIHKASGKPFAPAVLIPQIKKLFAEHPELKNSSDRPAINELVVRECEDTGTALLTEDEVDQWWTD
jgi:hypothetical protein